jgi:hypothetical protein
MPAEDALAAVQEWKKWSPDARMFSDYYDGNHKYPFASRKFISRYRWILEQARENLCPAVVDSFASKLLIQGWESGNDTEDKAAAKAMSEAVDELGLDVVIDMTHVEQLKCADAYVLVWPDADAMIRPWVKLASQSAVMPDYSRPGKLLWYATVDIDGDGYGRVNVYFGDRLERYRTGDKLRTQDLGDRPAEDIGTWPTMPDGYVEYDGDEDGPEIPHDFGRVPAVWFPHKARQLNTHGISILTDVVPIQDALNKSVADVIVNSEAYAMPLRALMNWKPKRTLNPDTGLPVVPKLEFDPSAKSLMGVEGNGPLTQLDPPDVSKINGLHDSFANKIARIVGLPAFYVSQPTGEPPSGASLRVLSSRLTDWARKTQKVNTPRWSEVADLLGLPGVRPVWVDPAPTDFSEELENAVTMKEIGYDQKTVLQKLGEDPDDIERILEAKADQAPPVGGPALVRSFESGMSLEDQTA